MTTHEPGSRLVRAARILERAAPRAALAFGIVACALAVSGAAQGQAYPSKPVRLIVPFAPGGTTDGIARIVAQKTSELLGQPVVVENRAGAGGNLGTDLVAKSAPDGYTLAMVGNSFTVNPTLFKSMPYRQSDLSAVVMAGTVPFVMVANPKSPFTTLPELITYAKAHPGKVNYGSGGNGTIGHLGAHWLSDLAKIKLQHIPYKGGSAAMTDLIGGQVDVFFDTLITSTPFLKSVRIRPLFVTTEKRIAVWPDIPTIAELGFPDLTFSAWVGIVAPAGTPKDAMERINREVNRALESVEVRQKLAALGAEPIGGSIAHAQQFMAQEAVRWGAVVRDSGAQAE